MIITLVMDQYGKLNNGSTATARSFTERMRKLGHTVRIVTSVKGVDEPDVYVVPERRFPFGISRIIRSHGMHLGHPCPIVLEEAMRGSDIVHFLFQFKLSQVGKKIADRLGIPSTAAFHLQPENISYNINLGKCRILNNYIYRKWRKFYNQFDYIHTPSQMMKDILIERKYTSNIYPISNGVHDVFVHNKVQRPTEYADKFVILMTGRLASEKRQDLLIKAIGKSKHNDKIQLILCGKGPKSKKIRKLSTKHLANPCVFKFVPKEELADIINYCDLYVHTSEIETEAIACMEAFMCGLVPIISDAKFSATKQFALTPHNLFRHNNTADLADKIDYFVDNPDILKDMRRQYLEYGEQFRLDKCIDSLHNMLKQELNKNKESSVS